DLQGKLSRRINIQHRIIYEILEDEHIIKMYRMWTHYE
ncbi:MAG TPA: Txe/YoeB family addiction module toxin, partial [Thermoanaerobacter sp.]|nr:Txe/YoeB family addiction module toxin [Thermoanaerobacter sp.]